MSTLKVDDIQSRQSTDDAISLASDSSVSLKHSASAKLTTTSTGVSITGTCAATAFSGDGSALTGLSAGVSSDSNRNTVGGTDSGSSFTSGSGNTLYGYKAGEAVTSGFNNTFLGDRVAPSLTDGHSNTVTGAEAGSALTSGTYNDLFGIYAGMAITTGNYNTCIGSQAGKAIDTGYENVLIGYKTGDSMTSASTNIGIGIECFRSQQTGNTNIAIGNYPMQNSDTASANVAIGAFALRNVTGQGNVAIGNAGVEVTSGGNNLLFGASAGRTASPSGELTTQSNNICLGNNNITDIYCADSSISSSDSRDKTDITNFDIGLAWIEALRPVTYRWDRRTWYGTDEQPYGTPDGSKKRQRLHLGFLAQEALEVEKANGYGNSNDDSLILNLTGDGMSYGIKYDRLVPILVNAIKELSAEVKALKAG